MATSKGRPHGETPGGSSDGDSGGCWIALLQRIRTSLPELSLDEHPDLAWDHPDNPEHVDVIPEFEGRLARERFVFKAPLVVITATHGQSNVADQAFSARLERAVPTGGHRRGHGVSEDSPDEVAAEILSLLPGGR